jgi:hypothetical protein
MMSLIPREFILCPLSTSVTQKFHLAAPNTEFVKTLCDLIILLLLK